MEKPEISTAKHTLIIYYFLTFRLYISFVNQLDRRNELYAVLRVTGTH